MKTIKKWTVYFLAAAVAATMAASSMAEEATTAATEAEAVHGEAGQPENETTMTGTILSLDADAGEMILESESMGEVVMRFESALLETLPALYPGVQVRVETTGIATLSLPAQMNAVSIQCDALQGTVIGFEDGRLLVETEAMGVVAANIGAGPRVYGLEYLAEGAQATLFYDGITTRSIPAQLTPDVLVFEAAAQTQAE